MSMDFSKKLEMIKNLSEADLRDTVATLLRYLGFRHVRVIHGGVEKGKDVIGYKTDEFGCQRALACVVKKGDISGSASGSNSIQTIINQTMQALNEEYNDTQLGKMVVFNEIRIIASGKIMPTAEESIRDSFKKQGLDKIIRFIGGERLIELIDESPDMKNYWNKESPPNIQAAVKNFEDILVSLHEHNPDIIDQKSNLKLTLISGTSTVQSFSVFGDEIQKYL